MLWLCLYFAQRNAQALEQVAAWAGQFSARVSPSPPDAVLLEIGASLRYFGGLERLRSRIESRLQRLGTSRASLGIAPTPSAAEWLARSGDSTPITERQQLAQRLAVLPITALGTDSATLAAIEGLGCKTIGELRVLPLDGLTRRVGSTLVHALQRAHGERPDPRANWQPPHQHHGHCELIEETIHTEQLKPALHHLIEGLCGHLRSLNAGVMQIEFQLLHRQPPHTALTLGMLTPGHDPERIQALLEHRLEQTTLPAGVIALNINAEHFHDLLPQRGDLLDRASDEPTADAWQALVENLDHRLGENRVRGLATAAEHRPERAWRYQRPGQSDTAAHDQLATAPRPFWLLPQPTPLSSPAGRPNYHGPLIFEAGPERIESGWWDGGDISRDYYRALSPQGERLWVFRERRKPRGWYLHGFFA